MLIGTYRHQIDEKFRMRMPAKFKEELGEGFEIVEEAVAEEAAE